MYVPTNSLWAKSEARNRIFYQKAALDCVPGSVPGLTHWILQVALGAGGYSLSPFDREGKWGLERLRHLSVVTKSGSLAQSPGSWPWPLSACTAAHLPPRPQVSRAHPVAPAFLGDHWCRGLPSSCDSTHSIQVVGVKFLGLAFFSLLLLLLLFSK